MSWKFWKHDPRLPDRRPQAGDNVGLLLRGIQRDQVLSGDVLSK